MRPSTTKVQRKSWTNLKRSKTNWRSLDSVCQSLTVEASCSTSTRRLSLKARSNARLLRRTISSRTLNCEWASFNSKSAKANSDEAKARPTPSPNSPSKRLMRTKKALSSEKKATASEERNHSATPSLPPDLPDQSFSHRPACLLFQTDSTPP